MRILQHFDFQRKWDYLIGSSKHFTFESRIFHTISVVAVMASVCIAWYNFSTTLFYAGCISVCFGVFQAMLYCLSRFAQKLKTAIVLSALQVNAIFIMGWIYNSGITGSISLLLLVSLAMLILVSTKRFWAYFFWVNLLITLGLISLEYYFPQLVRQRYSTRNELFTDHAFTYVAASFLLFVCTAQLRKNYDKQKKLAEDKAAKLGTLNEAKDKLFSIISHDLNAPLQSIEQYLDLLQSFDLEEAERKHLEKNLGKTVSDTRELLRNLLYWARSQMNNMPVNLQRINVQQQLAGCIEMFQNIALSKGIELKASIDPYITVTGDKDMIELVVRNLLNNAIKFCHPQGMIEIVAYSEAKRNIIIVKDDGIGIEEHLQKDIFSAGFRSSYGTANEKGTGLGLSLCRDFMVRQGGDIWLTSSPGVGTSFFVAFPQAR